MIKGKVEDRLLAASSMPLIKSLTCTPLKDTCRENLKRLKRQLSNLTYTQSEKEEDGSKGYYSYEFDSGDDDSGDDENPFD
ncbi:hypothetical protein ACH42_04455 [Endozoicomonas sp. (ex Bugula neritina AB1)]|nr:hypothetical protein ACH42_04455 [Endozoicomonas sp. (ex Bugula neritina AB1)]